MARWDDLKEPVKPHNGAWCISYSYVWTAVWGRVGLKELTAAQLVKMS